MGRYQCFKMNDRTVYCSSYKIKSDDEGKEWIRNAIAHYNLRASDMHGTPYESESIPKNAIIWP